MKNKIDYKKALNPAQLEAVMTINGPVLVIAGAGSGKTRTLVYRVACLVEKGVPPESILLLTFTRKAATEMLNRAAAIYNDGCMSVSGGTFHSLANQILRTYTDRTGYSNGFTIIDRSDMEQIITSLIPELNFLKRPPRFPKRGTIANILSKAANLQEPIEQIIAKEYVQFTTYISHIEKLCNLYTKYKQSNGLMDYDDLIIQLRDLLSDNPDVRHIIGQQYRYVMVDEYQDTNTIQADIIKWLVDEHKNIMAVGDDCQSIYSFRGANFRNMFDFPEQFPGTKIIRLEENYRSTQPILSFTNAMMEQADKKYTKCLFTKKQGGISPRIIEADTEPEQAAFVCRYIEDQRQKGRTLSEMAILFRAGFHSFELETSLTQQGIPYIKHGGFKFLESAHIKDLLAHLRVVVNREDTISWMRILTLIKGIGQAKANKIIAWMRSERVIPQDIMQWPGGTKKDLNLLKPVAGLLRKLATQGSSPRIAVKTAMNYYIPVMEEKFDDYPRRQKELDQLLAMAKYHNRLNSFIDALILDPPASTLDIEPEEKKKDMLTLSTVHSAKGLEWPIVFIISAKNGRFPTPMALKDPFALEEERRLMYVAATRAKEELIICYPREDTQPWQTNTGLYSNGPSLFIQSVPCNLAVHENTQGQCTATLTSSIKHNRPENRHINHDSLSELSGRKATQQARPNNHDQGTAYISTGKCVRHPAFGIGVVARFVDNDKVEVLFKDTGKKLLHMKYTKLEPVP